MNHQIFVCFPSCPNTISYQHIRVRLGSISWEPGSNLKVEYDNKHTIDHTNVCIAGEVSTLTNCLNTKLVNHVPHQYYTGIQYDINRFTTNTCVKYLSSVSTQHNIFSVSELFKVTRSLALRFQSNQLVARSLVNSTEITYQVIFNAREVCIVSGTVLQRSGDRDLEVTPSELPPYKIVLS